jgi:hypothetical protein
VATVVVGVRVVMPLSKYSTVVVERVLVVVAVVVAVLVAVVVVVGVSVIGGITGVVGVVGEGVVIGAVGALDAPPCPSPPKRFESRLERGFPAP